VGDGHAPPHVLGYGLVGRWRHSAQQQQQNGGASGPRMHDYAIRAGAAAIQAAPGLLSARTPVMTTNHAVIRGCSGAASASASASGTLGVALARRAVQVRVRASMMMMTLILTAVVFIVSDPDKSTTSKLMSRVI
jgi:hypothetical protein